MWWGLLVAVASLPNCPDTPGPIVIPLNTTEITFKKYWKCEELTGVTFNTDGTLKNINIGAFEQTNLAGPLTIPASVTSIQSSAFYYPQIAANPTWDTGPTQIIFDTSGGPSELLSIGTVSFNVTITTILSTCY